MKQSRTTAKPAKRRVRRDPAAAKELILDAADRVFATKLPDVAGLKDVAKAAGVTHGLVTHYFGTYDALVEATLERRFHKLRAHLLPTMVKLIAEEADVRKMLDAHRRAVADVVEDPAMVRLGIWAALSGRASAADFFPHRMQGLKLLADALESRSKARREDIEIALVTSFALAVVWKAAGPAIAGAMGKTPSKGLDAWFEARTADMLDAYLDRSTRRNA
jgi:TetR/AcrR family transcriptional regulator, repressor for neighboring sulfatase